MSDNARRFKTVLNSLKALHPMTPKGNAWRHLFTLAAMINGIIGSKSCQLPAIAAKVSDFSKLESRVKLFSRWLHNGKITYDTYFLPYAMALLQCLRHETLAIIFDASVVGRGCISVVACVVYKKRALPLCWITQTGNKGHLAESIHIQLALKLKTMIPKESMVVFLGDGEYDGANLIKTVYKNKWLFVSRTGKNRVLIENDESFSVRHIGCGREEYFRIPQVRFNMDNSVTFDVIMWWAKGYEEPIYLLTNIKPAQEAMYWYKRRFLIETMFSDQKSRGFHIHKSHIAEPERLNMLLIATCLAYILIIYFGIMAIQNGWSRHFHRTDRCDLSLFQLGMRTIEYHLNMGKSVQPIKQLTLFQSV